MLGLYVLWQTHLTKPWSKELSDRLLPISTVSRWDIACKILALLAGQRVLFVYSLRNILTTYFPLLT